MYVLRRKRRLQNANNRHLTANITINSNEITNDPPDKKVVAISHGCMQRVELSRFVAEIKFMLSRVLLIWSPPCIVSRALARVRYGWFNPDGQVRLPGVVRGEVTLFASRIGFSRSGCIAALSLCATKASIVFFACNFKEVSLAVKCVLNRRI